MEPTHLLLDFFGTLVDYSPSMTEQGYPRSFALAREAGAGFDYPGFLALWSETFAELESRAAESHVEFSMHEVTGRFLERALGGPAPQAAVEEFIRTYVTEWNRGVRYLPGVPELLGRLARRFSLAIVSNTHEAALVPEHLARMQVAPLFQQVVTSVDYGVRKPSPRIFRHALSRLGVDAGRCIHVGDSFDADYTGAQSAGIRVLLIDPARRWPVPDPARLDSIFALERRLADGHVR